MISVSTVPCHLMSRVPVDSQCREFIETLRKCKISVLCLRQPQRPHLALEPELASNAERRYDVLGNTNDQELHHLCYLCCFLVSSNYCIENDELEGNVKMDPFPLSSSSNISKPRQRVLGKCAHVTKWNKTSQISLVHYTKSSNKYEVWNTNCVILVTPHISLMCLYLHLKIGTA